MKAFQYRVVAPEKIEKKEVMIEDVPQGYSLLKTTLTAVCQSDLRYFFGRRDPDVLKKKYPICLLHEGIAEVIKSNGKFKPGERIVVIPNIPCYIHDKANKKCDYCNSDVGENYCKNVKFMSSNCDGMSQTHFLQPDGCIVPVPEEVPDDVAVLTELLTVVYRATIEANVNEKDKVIVFGCGRTGYLMAAFLHFIKKIKKENLYVTDILDERLKDTRKFSTAINTKRDIISGIVFDKAFECVGGKGSEESIDMALELLRPKGTLVLLGVSEEKRAIRTRVILDKGIIIKGTTRSPRQDYPDVLEFLKNKEFQNALLKIICNERFKADSTDELIKAFRKADDPRKYGKVLIEWN